MSVIKIDDIATREGNGNSGLRPRDGSPKRSLFHLRLLLHQHEPHVKGTMGGAHVTMPER